MTQKQLLAIFLGLFILSLLVVPEELSGVGESGKVTVFQGYVFVLDMTYEISLKMLLLEWFGLVVSYICLTKIFATKS
jgi:hypothetical protein